jgi:Arc/MetJ-type ribon-helix-helix transcriptional regulator
MNEATFKRYNFSLTESISRDIDEISLLSRDFRCSRSDAVKAAIKAFKELPPETQLLQLRSVCVADIDATEG